MSTKIISLEPIQDRIYFIRKQKVMLDRHLAQFYGVETRVLMQAVIEKSGTVPKKFYV